MRFFTPIVVAATVLGSADAQRRGDRGNRGGRAGRLSTLVEACPFTADVCGLSMDVDVTTMFDREAMQQTKECILTEPFESDTCEEVLVPIREAAAVRAAERAEKLAEKQAQIAELIATCPEVADECGITAATPDILERALADGTEFQALRENFACLKDLDLVELAGDGVSDDCITVLTELRSRTGGRGGRRGGRRGRRGF